MTEHEGTERSLSALRLEIDAIDQELLALLNARAACAQTVAAVKQAEAPDVAPVFYRPEREAQVLRQLIARNEGPLSNDRITQIFRPVSYTHLTLPTIYSV